MKGMELRWTDAEFEALAKLVIAIGPTLSGHTHSIVGLALVEHLCLLLNHFNGTEMDPDGIKALLIEKQPNGWNLSVYQKHQQH